MASYHASSTPSILCSCSRGPLPSPPAPQGFRHHTFALLLPQPGRPSSSWFYLLLVLSPGSPIRMTHSHDHLVCDFLPDSLLYMHTRLPTLHKLLGTGTVSDCSLTFSSASCAPSVLCRPHHGPLRHWLMVLRLCFSDAYPNHKSAWQLLINLDVANMSVCQDSSPVTRSEILFVIQTTWSTAISALCTRGGRASYTKAHARYHCLPDKPKYTEHEISLWSFTHESAVRPLQGLLWIPSNLERSVLHQKWAIPRLAFPPNTGGPPCSCVNLCTSSVQSKKREASCRQPLGKEFKVSHPWHWSAASSLPLVLWALIRKQPRKDAR